jgi:hypothetical protein
MFYGFGRGFWDEDEEDEFLVFLIQENYMCYVFVVFVDI